MFPIAGRSIADNPSIADGDITMTTTSGSAATAGQSVSFTQTVFGSVSAVVDEAGQPAFFAISVAASNGVATVNGQSPLCLLTMIANFGTTSISGQIVDLVSELEAAGAATASTAGQTALFSFTAAITHGGVTIDGQYFPLTIELEATDEGGVDITGHDAVFAVGIMAGAASVFVDGQTVILHFLAPATVRKALYRMASGTFWRGRSN